MTFHDLVRFLLDLFRGRLLLQFLFVCVWRSRGSDDCICRIFTDTLPARMCPTTMAHGACTSRGAQRQWGSQATARQARRSRAECFAVQLRHADGVPGVVRRHRIPAYALFAVWVGFGLLLSVDQRLVGGGIIFLFLSKVLMSEDENMDPADYEMVGVLGRICDADPRRRNRRNDLLANGNAPRLRRAQRRRRVPSPREREVVVTRYEKGIAYVRLWSEMSGDRSKRSLVPRSFEDEQSIRIWD